MTELRMARSKNGVPGAWMQAAQGFILDLDGTLIRGRRPLAGAVELLECLAGRFVILSNNSSDTAASLARTLRQGGLSVAPELLLLAGESTVHRLAATRPGLRVMLVGSRALRRLARCAGLTVTERDPEVVLLARDDDFSYRKLRTAANALREGAALLVTNPDLYHPAGDGLGIVPETGALLQALVACSGVEPAEIVGKPQAALFLAALRQLETSAAETLVIGDNPRTDALGALRLGMRFLLVGASRHADAPDLRSLLDHDGPPRAALADLRTDFAAPNRAAEALWFRAER